MESAGRGQVPGSHTTESHVLSEYPIRRYWTVPSDPDHRCRVDEGAPNDF